MDDYLTPDERYAIALHRSLSAHQRWFFNYWLHHAEFVTMLWFLGRIHNDPEHLLHLSAAISVDEAPFSSA